MVSQFVSTHQVRLLSDLDYNFPEGTHAVGRLDSNSEGILILTTNQKVTRLLFQAQMPHKRTYLVQVKSVVSNNSLHQLRNGVNFKVKGGEDYTTSYTDVQIVKRPGNLLIAGCELRDEIPNTWLQITLTEGKFHQVRKMVAAIHHRCRRLIRISIEDLELDNLALKPGEVKEIQENEFFEKLRIKSY